jgi:hypothetical protein
VNYLGTSQAYARNVNLLALGTSLVLPKTPGLGNLFFLPQICFVTLRALTGPALTTAPKFKIGGNAAHSDVAALFTVPLAASVGVVAVLPLVNSGNFSPVNIGTTDIMLEVTQIGVGPTAMLGDVLLIGWMVSSD